VLGAPRHLGQPELLLSGVWGWGWGRL